MTEHEIFIELNEHLKYVQKLYPVKNIFGIFATEVNEDSIKSETIILPEFEHICTSLDTITKNLTDNIAVFDAREIYRATESGHPEVIQSLRTPYKIVNPSYQHIFQKLYLNNRERIEKGIKEGIPAEELKIALIKFCRYCWGETSEAMKFIKQLTDAEKLALDGIVKLIGDEGTISQAKTASLVGVSRLTMTSLVTKLKFYNVAEVTYLGNKGTYIKFIDDLVLNIKNEKIY